MKSHNESTADLIMSAGVSAETPRYLRPRIVPAGWNLDTAVLIATLVFGARA